MLHSKEAQPQLSSQDSLLIHTRLPAHPDPTNENAPQMATIIATCENCGGGKEEAQNEKLFYCETGAEQL